MGIWKDPTIFYLDNAENLAVIVTDEKVVSFSKLEAPRANGQIQDLDVENNIIVLSVAGKKQLVQLRNFTELSKLILLRRPNGKARKELFPALLLPVQERQNLPHRRTTSQLGIQ